VIVHPTHVSDVVQACVKTLRLDACSERVINVGGERPVRFQDFVELTARVLHVPAWQLALPAWIGRPVALGTTRALRLARRRVPDSIERMSRPYINRSLDTALAMRLLGFEPIDLDTGLRQTTEGMLLPN
jgi:nucleoside-diphosphate-sugar epimerase